MTIGGFCAGIAAERWHQNNQEYKCNCFNHVEYNSIGRIRNLPGLPIFGTVSAASVLDTKISTLDSEISNIKPSPVQSNSSRISEVIIYY